MNCVERDNLVEDLKRLKSNLEWQEEKNRNWEVNLDGIIDSLEQMIDYYEGLDCEDD